MSTSATPRIGLARSVPLRRSLLMRLLAVSVLIAVCSIAATAWLAAQTTTRAIQQAQGQALSSDVMIYDTLVGYAATHPTWDGVEPTLQKLARNTGRQITLTTRQRGLIAGVSTALAPLPQKESAVVDALHTDAALQSGTDTGIDSRALGPYRLTPTKRREQQAIATKLLDCLTSIGYESKDLPLLTVQDLGGYISLRSDRVKVDLNEPSRLP